MKRYYFELLTEDYEDLGVCIPDGSHKQMAIKRAKAWMRDNCVRMANLSVNSIRTGNLLGIIEITIKK